MSIITTQIGLFSDDELTTATAGSRFTAATTHSATVIVIANIKIYIIANSIIVVIGTSTVKLHSN